MTGIEVAGSGWVSGGTTGQFLRLFTILPVGNVYMMLLLSGARHSIIWVLFVQMLDHRDIYLLCISGADTQLAVGRESGSARHAGGI
jgi:hypothetical protein